MKNNGFLYLLSLCFLASCDTQEPAPIDYASSLSLSSVEKSNQGSEKISSKRFIFKEEEDNANKKEDEKEKNVLQDKNTHHKLKKYVEEDSDDGEDLEKKTNQNKRIAPQQAEYESTKSDEDLDSELNSIEKNDAQKERVQKYPIEERKLSEKNEIYQAQEPQFSTSDDIFIYPVKGKIIAAFGDLVNGAKNGGVNFEVKLGEKVVASAKGTVMHIGKDNKYGNIVIMSHGNNIQTAYAHLESVTVHKGQELSQGDLIGLTGQTGEADRPILHFAVRADKVAVDPIKYLHKNK